MRNVTNQIVEGDDFYGREREIDRLFELLATGSVLLHGPRRMGKSSVLRRLHHVSEARGFARTAEIDVQGARDAASFVSELHRQLRGELRADVDRRIRKGRLKKLLGGIQFEAMGFRLAFESASPPPWTEIGDEVIAAIRSSSASTLLTIDELGVLLQHGFLDDPATGRARAHEFLSWLRRHWISTPPDAGRIAWVFSGSIGLPVLSRRHRLGDTLGGLAPFEMPEFHRDDALGLLRSLASGAIPPMTLDPAVAESMLDRLGWACPQHVQDLFDLVRAEARRSHGERVEERHVDAAWGQLVSRGVASSLDWWDQRLEDELGRVEAALARAMLARCAADPDGATLTTLRVALAPATPRDGPCAVTEMADVLEHDGYLVRAGDRRRFRSHLIRAYWRARFPS